jgi:hypothetical protein
MQVYKGLFAARNVVLAIDCLVVVQSTKSFLDYIAKTLHFQVVEGFRMVEE